MTTDHKGRKVINPFNTTHVILDLETLDTSPKAAIIAAGIVILNPDLEVKFAGEYILTAPLDNPYEDGRYGNYKVSSSTVDWWRANQQDEARYYIQDSGTYSILRDMLTVLSTDILNNTEKDNFLIYGNPSTFDITIIENSFKQLRIQTPWSYHQTACLRTVARFIPQEVKDAITFEGIMHTPLADAYHEAKELIHLLSYLRE